MRRAEGDEIRDWRTVAPLDVRPYEQATLREAYRVDSGRVGQLGDVGYKGADFSDLLGQVAPKRGRLIRLGIVCYTNVVDVGARIDLLGKLANGFEAIGVEAK